MLDVDRKAKRREIMEHYAHQLRLQRSIAWQRICDARQDLKEHRRRLQDSRDRALARLDNEPRLP